MNIIDLACMEIEPPRWQKKFIALSKKILEKLDITGWELSLVLCDDSFIQELNKTYRGKDEATDVLSFVQNDGGDIIISVDSLKKNAAYFSESEETELKRLLIHGILHLSGENHATNDKNEPMLMKQEELLQAFLEVKLF